VPCADRYDATGPEAAAPIVNGETQQRVICPAGETEWASFFAASGKTYGISTAPGSSPELDTELWVLDRQPDGTLSEVAYNDDAPGGAPGYALLEFTAPHDGWYLLKLDVKGGIGYPGLVVALRLNLVPARPTATVTLTPRPPAATATPVGSAVAAAVGASAAPTDTPTPDPLFHPLPGSARSQNLPVILAGDADPTGPDRFDQEAGDDTLETAAPLAVGMLYESLNFIPRPGQPWDSDFYIFQTKPGTCYQVFTADLSAGLDTTLLLWHTTVTPTDTGLLIAADPTRTPLAQNDDAQPGSADARSLISWCSRQDQAVVVEAHTHHWQPLLDLHHRTYALGILVAPPTPTPSPSATRTPLPPALPPAGPAASGPPPAPAGPSGGVEPFTRPPTGSPVSPTSYPIPPATPVLATPFPSAVPPSATPRVAPSATRAASATPTPPLVAVDVVAYFTAARGTSASNGPNPNTAIPDLQVWLVDLQTNQPVAAAQTDAYGHASLRWTWQGPVQIAVPQLQQAHLIEARDLGLGPTGAINSPNGGKLYLPITAQAYAPPGICP
jgi:hypothetical protein